MLPLCVLSYNEGMLHDYGVDLMDTGILTFSFFFLFFLFSPLFLYLHVRSKHLTKGNPCMGDGAKETPL